MSQRELADLLGVTGRSIQAYEQGEVIPYRFVRQLESALGRPAAWFLHGDAAVNVRDEQYDEILRELRGLKRAVERLAQAAGS
jgi:transcriptional regulator with XRE-family HTH domain